MSDALSIATSGLVAQQTRLGATANNIANISSTGAVPGSDAPASANTVYKPLNVSLTSLGQNGVSANVTADPKGYSLAYDPSSPDANTGGYIAAPDVDLAQQSVNLLEIKTAYKANLAVIKTEDQMQKDLLNTIA